MTNGETTDAERRDAALAKLAAASGHFQQTTKGYRQMPKPLPATSQWGQGYEDFYEAVKLIEGIASRRTRSRLRLPPLSKVSAPIGWRTSARSRT